jgi:hypothetical protein
MKLIFVRFFRFITQSIFFNFGIFFLTFHGFVEMVYAQSSYLNYCNTRFNYCITYPEAKLNQQPESQNGDGRVFLSKKGTAKVTVWASNAMDVMEPDLGFKSVYIGSAYSKDIRYEVVKKDWFIISGYTEDGLIFYQKTILKNGVIATVLLEYPNEERKDWDKECGKIAGSLTLK